MILDTGMYKNKTTLEYINWGLRARGVFTAEEVESAYQLGVVDGRLKIDDTVVSDFEKRQQSLLYLCEYGDEIIYSR